MATQLMKPMIPVAQEFDVTVGDVEYQRLKGVPLLVRIYRPEGTSPRAALLAVHGGAWTAGDRTSAQALDQAMAANGVLVASIDMHMAPEYPHPWQVVDANLGVRWLKQHATELGAQPDALIGLTGGSSGGHIAILSALRPDHPDYATLSLDTGQDLDATVDFVVVDAPVTNPSDRYQRWVREGRTADLERFRQYWPTDEAAADASLNLMLARGERVHTPPMLITQGTDDQRVPLPNTQDFVERYRQAGGEVELITFEGLGHGFAMQDPTRPEAVQQIELAVAFVKRQVARRTPGGVARGQRSR